MEDISLLLARDHDDLDRLSHALITHDVRSPQWRSTLETTRRLFSAHAEAERHALQHRAVPEITTGPLARLLAAVEREHHEQALLLEALSQDASPGQLEIHALELRTSLLAHALDEKLLLMTSLRELLHVTELVEVGTSYTTRRGYLRPSAQRQ